MGIRKWIESKKIDGLDIAKWSWHNIRNFLFIPRWFQESTHYKKSSNRNKANDECFFTAVKNDKNLKKL
jgi:hypothetical protein